MTDVVSLVENALALESMRNSDFDVYSAYGEVIDNSIQADAKNIDVWIDYQPTAKNAPEPINFVAFADDGHGMPENILHRCLQLGYSSRYNDRSGIGRFGVGATLAAINQCKCIEVYSRQSKSDPWLYTFVDLEKIANKSQEAIPLPVSKEIPKNFKKVHRFDKGTLVIWSKYDRAPTSASEIKDEFEIWAGRTYRRAIWKGLSIRINNEPVHAIDPLYVTTEKTKFPNDPPATEFNEMKIDWPIPPEDKSGSRKNSQIKIRMSILPEELRPNTGVGNSSATKARHINLNEGISILRNDREVFYGHIPYWPGEPFKEIDRWWGCEISFHAELDREFTVKNIKRGAVPIKELKQAIAQKIGPTRASALEVVRDLWNKAKTAGQTQDAANGVDTGHSDAEHAASATVTPNNLLDKGKDAKKEAENLTNTEEWLKHADDQQKAAWAAKFQSQPFTIVDDQWKGPEFFETVFLGGKSVLKYNMRHVFFVEIEAIRNHLKNEGNSNPQARRLKALIDLLLIAYAKSEAMFDPTLTMSADRFIEQLRMSWGNYLSNYIDTFQKENVGD
jgi:hypothetical protein